MLSHHPPPYKCAEPPSRKATVNMCKGNFKPEIEAMMVSFETKSLDKLREAVVEAKNVHKEFIRPAWPDRLTRRSDIKLSCQENNDRYKQI